MCSYTQIYKKFLYLSSMEVLKIDEWLSVKQGAQFEFDDKFKHSAFRKVDGVIFGIGYTILNTLTNKCGVICEFCDDLIHVRIRKDMYVEIKHIERITYAEYIMMKSQ